MTYNKIVFGNTVLMDLTSDTVTEDDVKANVTFHDKAGVARIGTSSLDSDTTNATATTDEILAGKTAYARGAKLTGTMPNKGAVALTIETTASVAIPQGYHDGSGIAVISNTEAAKIIGDNIRKGVTILGVTGTMEEESENPQTGIQATSRKGESYIITPSTGYTCFREVTVMPIPYTETENAAGGLTATIG